MRDGYGSFVRPQRLNFGIRMIDAIEKRYGSLSDDIGNQSLYVLDANNQRTSVEAVGFEKWKTALKYVIMKNTVFNSIDFILLFPKFFV